MSVDNHVELHKKIIGKVYPLYFAFGATRNENDAALSRLVGIIEDDFERYPELPKMLDENNSWTHYIIQTAFRNVA